ncbi:MAG: rhodanese-like domain-containing protein [candidate division WOR-3 bacterium]|nr:rhodanese-like domain-containing protein [candidate division WOR-3 bacterium]MDH5684262.1 rhodanese-like domain-containing protein [candidate division WOR-3 bacterium]
MKFKIALLLTLIIAALPVLAAEPKMGEAADKFVNSVPGNMMFLLPVKDLANALAANDTTWVVLDIRPPAHYMNGHIKGAIHVPLTMLVKEMKKIPMNRKIAVVCAMDTNSAFAVAILRMYGYDAWIVDGGVPGWVKMGMPLEK